MSSIYYPYFLIEKSTHKKYNHRQYLYLLSMFCDKILIPCRHILNIGNDEFDILINNDKLLKRNIVYFRLPSHIENINDYYDTIKSDPTDIDETTIISRINKINKILANNDHYIRYEPKDQMSYYTLKMKEFIKVYLKKYHITHINEVKNIFPQGAKTIKKEFFDEQIALLLSKRRISKKTYSSLKKASDILYFIAGASQGKLKVCYDSYFNYDCIRAELDFVINNYNEIINMDYMPDNILNELKNLGIIKENNDICNLNCDDIVELHTNKYAKKFIEKYCRLATNGRAIEWLKKKEKAFKNIKNIKNGIFAILIGSLATSLSFIIPLFSNSFVIEISVGLVACLISYTARKICEKRNISVKFIENILDTIIAWIDSDLIYLYTIYSKIKNS